MAADEIQHYMEATSRLTGERQELKEALETACDVAIWMSGSPSFSPEGEAHDGWVKQRERLYEAMAVLQGA